MRGPTVPSAAVSPDSAAPLRGLAVDEWTPALVGGRPDCSSVRHSAPGCGWSRAGKRAELSSC
jgi:hypothetical protein